MLEIYLGDDLLEIFRSFLGRPWYKEPLMAAIVTGFFTALSAFSVQSMNCFSERKRELHKERMLEKEFNIKNKERIHEQKIAALKEFVELKESMLPLLWGSPYSDAYEFYEEFLIYRSRDYADRLSDYIIAWVYITSSEFSVKLYEVMWIFNSIDYEEIERQIADYSASRSELSKIEEVCKKMDEALDIFKIEMGIIDK